MEIVYEQSIESYMVNASFTKTGRTKLILTSPRGETRTFRLEQKTIRNRLIITLPLLGLGGLLTWFAIVNDNGFQIIWRYFSWSNQTLAMIALWVATAYLLREGKRRFGALLTALPAAFLTAVSVSYILMAGEGFRLDRGISCAVGAAAAAVLLTVYLIALLRKK